MITTSVRGHLANQDFPPDYGWSKVDPIELFSAPIHVGYRDDLKPLERMLKNLSRNAQVLILWLDCDREGEAIGEEVRQVCVDSNPRLNVFRARFSTVMAPEIKRALRTLGRLNNNLVHAVQARSECDLRVGSAFTRFQTLRLQRRFDGFSEQGVVSYGPCQFPTLGFVVERWARIHTFVPQNFWYIELSITVDPDGMDDGETNRNSTNGRPIMFTWKRNRLYEQVTCLCLYEACLEVGEAIVTDLSGRPKNKWRPVPLATVELQKRASRYLRIGSETLMTAAEELYNQGFISYPRTETEKFRPEFQHRPLIEQIANIGGDIGVYAARLLTDNNFQLPRAGQNDDQAHPPITPCKIVDPGSIQNTTHRSVYTLVMKHYLACCSRDAIGRETQISVQVGVEEFTAKGLMVLERNWLDIYHPFERWSTGQGELPALQVGSRIIPTSLTMKEGTTEPPNLISEVELISIMDRNKIGTDATIAQHISTIQEREYAMKDANQRFTPTQLGIALVEVYNSMGYQLNKPDLRREMESECNHIAGGRKSKDEVVNYVLAKMRECYVGVIRDAHKLDEAVARHFPRLGSSNATSVTLNARFSECGVCHGMMALKQERGNGRNVVSRKMLFCSTCSSGVTLPRGNHQPKVDDATGQAMRCAICAFQVVYNGRGDGYEGNGYHVCPKCYNDPPAQHGGSASSAGAFRCFNCQHPTCSLASGTPGGDIEVFSCPFCAQSGNPDQPVVVKKNSRGFVLACSKFIPGQDRCTYTIWLPKQCEQVSTATGNENQNDVCSQCSRMDKIVRKLHFVWRSGSVPPHMGRECRVCILCDREFRSEMQITLPNPNQVRARPPVQPAGGRTLRTGGRNTGRARGGGGRVASHAARGGRFGSSRDQSGGNVCYSCGESGHFASNCPTNR